jgi:hypothetical protein
MPKPIQPDQATADRYAAMSDEEFRAEWLAGLDRLECACGRLFGKLSKAADAIQRGEPLR